MAVAAGADGLVVQGPDAGGHRGTFAPDMESRNRVVHRTAGSHRQRPRRSADRRRWPGQHRRRRRRAAQGSGGRPDRHRAAAVRRGRHQRRTPLGPGASAIRHNRCHPGVFGPLRARPGERLHPDARPHRAAGLSRGQPDDLADPQGRGRAGRPARHQPVGGDGVSAGRRPGRRRTSSARSATSRSATDVAACGAPTAWRIPVGWPPGAERLRAHSRPPIARRPAARRRSTRPAR